MSARVVLNPLRDPAAVSAPTGAPRALHERLAGYSPTPLVESRELAAELGVREVLVKDESSRLGLPAFKALGAWWAGRRLLAERLGEEPTPLEPAELAARVARLQPLVLLAATDGNHGRAVARIASALGLGARIFVPREMVPARREAIEREGALAAAVARHFRRPGPRSQPRLLGVEPESAACMLASIEARRPVTLAGPVETIVAGLSCAAPSPVAWPDVSAGFDAFGAVPDELARGGMRALANAGLAGGECPGAAVGAGRALLREPSAEAQRAALGLDASSSVLVLLTEGPTDPAGYEAAVGSRARPRSRLR